MANYPTSASTDANLYVAVNSLATTLVGALTSSGGNNGANIEVSSTANFPAAGFITIDQEAISYTSLLSAPPRFAGITRGADGTIAASHANGSTVKHNVIAAHHNVLKDEIIAIETNNLPGQRKGTATNDNASAGNVGEYVESVISTQTNFPASVAFGDLTSISLTAGDWDITAQILVTLNGADLTGTLFGIATIAGNDGTWQIGGDNKMEPGLPTASQRTGGTIHRRVSIASTTTYYLKYFANYASGTPQAAGRLSARRVR